MNAGDVALRYVDHAAATPILPEVVELVTEVMSTSVGNPSGSHRAARQARRWIEDARDELAAVVGCRPHEVIFCSGGTEADALAVQGLGLTMGDLGRDRGQSGAALCGATEHPAILDRVLADGGGIIAVDVDGRIDLDDLREQSSNAPRVVSVMTVNHEVGTIAPLASIAEVVRSSAPLAVLHSDATQALRWLEMSDIWASVDALTLSSHKFGGPEGVGALVVRDGVDLRAVQLGGGQERERRSGSHDVAGIVGMARAATLANERRSETTEICLALRDALETGLAARVDDMAVLGGGADRVPGISMCALAGVESEALLFLLDAAGIAASAGSSCASGAQEPSHVLAAMRIEPRLGRGSIRFSFGRGNTMDDVSAILDVVPAAVRRLRELGS